MNDLHGDGHRADPPIVPDEAIASFNQARDSHWHTGYCEARAGEFGKADCCIHAGLAAAYPDMVLANGLGRVAAQLQANALRGIADDIERIADEPVDVRPAGTTGPPLLAEAHPRHKTGMLAAASTIRRHANKLERGGE